MDLRKTLAALSLCAPLGLLSGCGPDFVTIEDEGPKPVSNLFTDLNGDGRMDMISADYRGRGKYHILVNYQTPSGHMADPLLIIREKRDSSRPPHK